MTRIIVYLIAITWAVYCYSNAFFFFPLYLGIYEFPKEITGVLVAAFYATTTIVRPIGGWVAERVGIRRTLILSGIVCLLSVSLKFVAISFWSLLFIRLLMGCGFGIFVVALTTYQSLVIPEKKRGTAFGFISIGSLCCLFTVVPLADFLIAYSYPNLFLTLPVIVSIICIWLSMRLPPLAEGLKFSKNNEWGTWRELYNETPFWRISVSNLLFSLCDAANIYIPVLGVTLGLIPSSFAVANGLGALTVRTLGRKVFDLFPRYYLAGPSLLTMAVALCLTTVVTNNLLFFCCGFLFGIGMGYGYPAHLAMVGDLAAPKLRAKLSSLVHLCTDISWFLLPVYVGFMSKYTGELGSFKIFAAVCVLSGIFVTFMWRQKCSFSR